ncbi:hypothetical protein LCGC14_0829350 [marine sediment metagenome]|uniref:ParB/Sulfiredoxin domain-containing protein n=1 Tax=marine sediment metagenome TaxID=412755 RepID=A0A0F9S1A1_9ZZZZ
MFSYKNLGNFTYHIIKDKDKIKLVLLKWLGKEWKLDHEEFPDQTWTIEWLKLLPEMNYMLMTLDLEKINLREDLMKYKTDNYNFLEELNLRADEMEESVLQGSSIGPLIIKNNGFELMDGYTRYMILKKHQQKKVYAYVGFS